MKKIVLIISALLFTAIFFLFFITKKNKKIGQTNEWRDEDLFW
jgi:uncharacterized protein YxeA